MKSTKRLTRFLISAFLYYTRLLDLWMILGRNNKPIILMYHRILSRPEEGLTSKMPGMAVTLDTFEREMKFLRQKFCLLSVQKFLDGINRGQRILANRVLVTFDDGWKDNYDNAYPVLIKYRIPAIILLAIDYVRHDRWFWPEMLCRVLENMYDKRLKLTFQADFAHLPEVGLALSQLDTSTGIPEIEKIYSLIETLKGLELETIYALIHELASRLGVNLKNVQARRTVLNWKEIKEMSEDGISFGSHACSHAILTRIPISTARHEINTSKIEIEKYLRKPVLAFAYPNGDWNNSIRRLVIENDYRCAFSTDTTLSKRPLDRFTLTRVCVHEDFAAGVMGGFSKTVFAAEIAGFFDALLWFKRKRRS